jgi:uncharacterized DUF497 family protein
MAQDIQLTVVYTDRAETRGEVFRRIVSARVSDRRERQAYKDAIRASSSLDKGAG